MKKIICSLLLITVLLSGCSPKYGSIVEKESKNIEFKIEDNKHLIIGNENDSFYVSSEIVASEFAHSKDIGIIFKDENGVLSAEKSFKENKGLTAMINGVSFSKKLVEVNGKIYKLESYTEKKENSLDINTLFESMTKDNKLRLSPENYEEFIDDDGNVYSLGENISADTVGVFLYPVSLNGKDIYTITFNKENGRIYDSKERLTMITDGKEADKIKTLNYIGIFQITDGEVAVRIDDKYYELLAK